MNEQRMQILEMVAENKLTVDEADRLIAALDDTPTQNQATPESKPKRPKYLRVLVDSRDDGEQTHVNVRIPIQLIRAGVKLASIIPPKALDQANIELQRSGMPIDLTRLKPEDIDELIDHLGDMTVEVEDHENKVHVFCE
ncbi:hypothetical protein Rhe02_58000 [Rhizocola hellebori]|uniref:YvlB/LiaX N-terminal domain-containing protein n=1 Tax=Rhizocola hellebori TaxID=1392758 RepID=A0A8J3QDK5_9ACTN|nr:hypothetical protein [Rhizocola hellebori]GIH07733.1 hypothetical protein Rhe02_58000 [Rhizocola hellebori]